MFRVQHERALLKTAEAERRESRSGGRCSRRVLADTEVTPGGPAPPAPRAREVMPPGAASSPTKTNKADPEAVSAAMAQGEPVIAKCAASGRRRLTG